MIATDEDALLCDLAETYHIYDYKSLPVKRVAILCVGLRENSRIKQKISGNKSSIETILLASAVDYLALIFWSKTKDGQRGIGRPDSVVTQLLGVNEEKAMLVFDTSEEFERKRRELLEKGGS